MGQNAHRVISTRSCGLTAQSLLLRADSRENRDQDYCGEQRGDYIDGVEVRKILDDVCKEEIDQATQERAYQPYDQSSPKLP